MMRRAMRTVWLAAVVLAACGGGGDGDDDDGPDDTPPNLLTITNQPATGTIAGVTWTIGTRFMNITDGEIFVDLLQDAVEDCTKDETDGSFPFIIFSVPAQTGRFILGEDHFVTFVDKANSNLVVGKGVIEIDKVSDVVISGGLHVFDSAFGEVDGRFDGKTCFSN